MSIYKEKAKERPVDAAADALEKDRTGMGPGGAISVLVDVASKPGERSGDAQGILSRTITQHPDPQVRVAAARSLGTVGGESALRALRKVADETQDGQVVSAVAEALSVVGGPSDRDRLRAAAERTKWPRAAQSAQVAARLLTHRLGLDWSPQEDLTLPNEKAPRLKPTAGHGTKVQLIDVPVKPDLRQSDPAWAGLVPETAKLAGAFSCGARKHVVLANADLASLERGPGVAGALLGINESTDETFVRYLVLTRPIGRKLDVVLSTPNGKVAFVGSGQITGDGIEVELTAVKTPGAAGAEVKASVQGGTLQLSGLSDTTLTVPALVPRAAF